MDNTFNQSKKTHLVINCFTLQDSHKFRGIGRYTKEIITNISKLYEEDHSLTQDLKTTLVIASPKKSNFRSEFNISSKVKIYRIPKSLVQRNLVKLMQYKFQIAPYLKKLFKSNNDYINIYFVPRHQILLSKDADCNISTVHDLIPLVTGMKHNKNIFLNFLLKKEYNYFLKQLKNADRIITISNSSKDYLKKFINISSEHIDTVYLASSFTSSEKPNLKDKENMDKEKYFVYYGGYDTNKNLPKILEVFSNTLDNYKIKDLKLKLIGGVDKKNELKPFIDKYKIENYIELTHKLDEKDLIHTIQSSLGLIRLSLAEGFGLPELEAMSLGVPVITSNIPTAKELFDKYAFTFDPINPVGMREAIQKVYKGEVSKENLKEAKNYAESFTWSKTTKEILKSIKKAGKTI